MGRIYQMHVTGPREQWFWGLNTITLDILSASSRTAMPTALRMQSQTAMGVRPVAGMGPRDAARGYEVSTDIGGADEDGAAAINERAPVVAFVMTVTSCGLMMVPYWTCLSS